MTKNPFKPCPMCGSRRIRLLEYKEQGLMVQCENCDLRLVSVSTIRDALGQSGMIRRWNTRRQPDSDPTADKHVWNYTTNAILKRMNLKPKRNKK